ncbi:MAG: formylglycine-generating enzyme family protein [Bacteroidales bacterium]|nr:formylglycine-generating enzyme family protein [Bacteroidales bacterium]
MVPEDCVLDRTGFPYVPLPGIRTAIAILPITKAQVELWLAEPHGPGDEWYAEMLTHNPRLGWRETRTGPDTELFLSGLLPQEAENFAHWLGAGYRLPNLAEWRAADRALSQTSPKWAVQLADYLAGHGGHPAAIGVLQRLARTRSASSQSLFFLQDGFLEWVTKPGNAPGGFGRPSEKRTGGMILDPQAFDPVVSIRGGRNPLFSARLAYSLPT